MAVVWIQCFSFGSRGGGGGDGTKRYWKMKRGQRAHLDSMVRKRDTKRWRGDVSQRRGSTGEGKETTPVGLTRILLDRKIKKIHMVDSAATNRR
jgi:hypothetical protein